MVPRIASVKARMGPIKEKNVLKRLDGTKNHSELGDL
jgi:hypothetical protein